LGILITLVILYFIGKNTETNNLPEELPLPENMSNIDSMTENILQSLNNGNYTGFSRDFSGRIELILTEASFIEVRNLISETSGKYISKTTPKLYEIEGYNTLDYLCKFEKENVFVTLSLSKDLEKVEGILFDSPTLRERTGQ